MTIPEHERVPRIPFKDLSFFRSFCSSLGILSVELHNAQNKNDQETEHYAAHERDCLIEEFGDWVDDMLVRP